MTYAAPLVNPQTAAERFLEAALGGSIAGLMEVLAPDVTSGGCPRSRWPSPRLG
ncbi:hypothetical protein [Nonomuraea marmarensis]|uniref:hypothetical protein n=1 Tax=Nonomuraea marmarensis TaxID=3351344 RepID=UPI00371D0F32